MERLTQEELDIKIHHFLADRFAAHPELVNSKNAHSKSNDRHEAKFRTAVKRLPSSQHKNRPMFQHQSF